MKTIIYGTGFTYEALKHELPKNLSIVAYMDSHKEKATSYSGNRFEGQVVLLPEELDTIDYDLIYICTGSDAAYTINENLLKLGVRWNQIKYLYRKYIEYPWESELDSDGNILHRINGIVVRERKGNKSDYQTISELFCTNCYNLDIYYPNTVVIDMGMNIGLASLLFAAKENVCKVYSYEPFVDTYRAALYNFSLNEHLSTKISAFNMAVFDFTGTKEIPVLTEFAGGRTTELEYVEKSETCGSCRKELIQYKNASELLAQIFSENPECRFVMKIDTEGAEFHIFKALKGTGLLSKIDAVVMEYHREPSSILEDLRLHGFQCVATGNKNIGLIYAIHIG